MKEFLIKDIRAFLSGEVTFSYDFLRGLLTGMYWADEITEGEYELWTDLLFLHVHGQHSMDFMSK